MKLEIKTIDDLNRYIKGTDKILDYNSEDENYISYLNIDFVMSEFEIDYNLIFKSNISHIDVIEKYKKLIFNKSSISRIKLGWYDLAIFDILHVIEKVNPKHNSFYSRIGYELKKLRKERRKLKDFDNFSNIKREIKNINKIINNYVKPKNTSKRKIYDTKYTPKTNIINRFNTEIVDYEIDNIRIKKSLNHCTNGKMSEISNYMNKYDVENQNNFN